MQQFNDTYDDGFSGGGLATIGAIAAGLKPIHAVEYDAAIADVYRRNIGNHMLVKPIQEVDWTVLPVPYWRHMSPVCTRASQANSDGEESDLDLAMAQAVARSIAAHPPMFSLENVWQYRNFESFKIILRALRKHGYALDYWHLNSADYGVSQTRKRLILVASRVKAVRKPVPTHAEASELTPMFETRLPWVGWYAAIEDLIPTLPESKFAAWQLARLPEEMRDSFMVGGANTSEEQAAPGVGVSLRSQPTRAVNASNAQHWRAFIVSNAATEYSDGIRDATEPMLSVTTQTDGRARAWLVSSIDATIRRGDEPANTLVNSGDGHSIPPRAWLSAGRVVKMVPRALARFMSVPDWYQLPEKNSLACTVIGNGVPCRLMEAVINANR